MALSVNFDKITSDSLAGHLLTLSSALALAYSCGALLLCAVIIGAAITFLADKHAANSRMLRTMLLRNEISALSSKEIFSFDRFFNMRYLDEPDQLKAERLRRKHAIIDSEPLLYV